MGFLEKIDSLEEINPMDVVAKKTIDEEYSSYQEVVSGDKQEKWRYETYKEVDDLRKKSTWTLKKKSSLPRSTKILP